MRERNTMTRSVLNFIFSGGSTDDLMASTNALRIVCEKTFADCEWTINVDVSRQGSTLTVAVDGATFENVRAAREQYLTHLRTTTFKYAEPSFQYDGVDINTAIRSKPSEHDCSAFGVVMILDFEGAQEIKPDIQTLYQVSMVAKQLQDIQSLIQYYQTYSDTHDEINKLYALEARAKNLLGSIQRTARIQVYALLAI